MAWIRVGPKQDRLLNLECFVDFEMVDCGGRPGDRWAVQGLRADGSTERLMEGDEAECAAVLDELAHVVWAMGVGADPPVKT